MPVIGSWRIVTSQRDESHFPATERDPGSGCVAGLAAGPSFTMADAASFPSRLNTQRASDEPAGAANLVGNGPSTEPLQIVNVSSSTVKMPLRTFQFALVNLPFAAASAWLRSSPFVRSSCLAGAGGDFPKLIVLGLRVESSTK